MSDNEETQSKSVNPLSLNSQNNTTLPNQPELTITSMDIENQKAIDLLLGEGGIEAVDRAIEIWTRLANIGQHADAIAWLAHCYKNGYGTLLRNDQIADNLYRKSANLGNNYALGICYYYGIGCEMDYIKAFASAIKDAKDNDPRSFNAIGFYYYYGKGVEKNLSLSFKNYKMAADQGNPSALNSVAIFYYYGNAVEKDFSIAYKYYQKAAYKGYIDAFNNLGICYYNGDGVEKDYKLAFRYFKLSADKKNVDGIKNFNKLFHIYNRNA